MRSWMLISLLLLSLLIHEAQAIRLIRKGTPSDVQHIISPIKTLKQRSMNGVEEVIQCKANECSGSVRKLMVNPISSTTKNNKNKERAATKEETVNGESSSSSSSSSASATEQRKPGAGESYPGVLDIAGMDYSQARRKPPIHN